MKQLLNLLFLSLLIAFQSCNELETFIVYPTAIVETNYVEATPSSLTFDIKVTDADSWKYIYSKSDEIPAVDTIIAYGTTGEGEKIVVENLDSSTEYNIYVVAIKKLNYSEVATAAGKTSIGAPVVGLTATEVHGKTIVIEVSLDNPASWKYLLKLASEQAPSIETVKTDGTAGGIENTIIIDTLKPETAYKLYVVATSALDLDSDLIILDVTTTAVGAPSVTVSNTAQTNTTLTFEVNAREASEWKYLYIAKEDPAPTLDAVIAASNPNIGSGSSVILSGLTQGITYVIYVVAKNTIGNSAMMTAEATTIAIASVSSSTNPSRPATRNSLSYDVTVSSTNSWKYLHIPSSTPAPNAATIMNFGTPGKNNWVTISNLEESTGYTIYVIVTSSDGVNSDILSASASTNAEAKPIAAVAATDIQHNSITYTINLIDAVSWRYIHQLASAIPPTPTELAAGTLCTPDASPLTLGGLVPSTKYKLYIEALDWTDSKGDRAIVETSTSPLVDYYQMWVDEIDFKVGNITVNKTNYPDAPTLINPSNITGIATINKKGLVFVNNLDPNSLSSSITGGNIDQEVIIIGRYKLPKQATITTSKSIFCQGGITAFKNMKIAGNTGYLFGTNKAKKDPFLILDDCDIATTSSIVYDNATKFNLSSIYINNCVIKFSSTTGKSLINFILTNQNERLQSLTNITLTNNVIYPEAVTNITIMNSGSNDPVEASTPNLDVIIRNNTFYNLYHDKGLIRATGFKSMNISSNVCYLNSNRSSFLIGVHKMNTSSTTAENYLYNAQNTLWTISYVNGFEFPNNEIFINNNAQNPFSTVNLATGYFPINRSKVTNGAGADYDTKYWVVK